MYSDNLPCTNKKLPISDFVGTDGGTGDWGTFEYCPKGQFVHAYDLKTEADQGTGDDSAVNAVRLYCMDNPATSESGPLTNSITSDSGKWGSWGSVTYCPGAHNPFVGFNLWIDAARDGVTDATGVNKMGVMCRDGQRIQAETSASRGDQTQDIKCQDGFAAIGIQTRVVPDQGPTADDLALNGVRLVCAKYEVKQPGKCLCY